MPGSVSSGDGKSDKNPPKLKDKSWTKFCEDVEVWEMWTEVPEAKLVVARRVAAPRHHMQEGQRRGGGELSGAARLSARVRERRDKQQVREKRWINVYMSADPEDAEDGGADVGGAGSAPSFSAMFK